MKWLVRILTIACWSLAIHADPLADDSPLSLDEAVETALQLAPDLEARQARLDSAQSMAVSAGRLPDPQLVLGLDNLPVTGPDAWSTTRDFMTMRRIGVMQEFPRRQKRELQHARAEADASIAEAELVASRLTVAREVATAWIRRATASASLDELRALEPEVELGATSAKAAVASGKGSTSDAFAAESAAARLRSRMLELDAVQQEAKAELAAWIGREAAREPASIPTFDVLPTPPAALLSNLHEHGALQSLEPRIAAARLDVDLARAERRPDWGVGLSFAKRGPDYSDMVSLELTIGLPIFPGNRQDPVIAARGAEARQIEAERAVEIRAHSTELRKTLIEWTQLGARLEQYERDLLPLARERSQAALAAYRAGRDDLRPVLDAYDEEIELRIEHSELLNDRGRAWAALRYLTAADVRP